jgi:hypothetical protein
VADAPWRCSQCGTVNEPVANACRTCGRWPSLFDLERSTIPSEEPISYDDADEYAAQTVDVEVAEPEVYDTGGEVETPVELEPLESEHDYGDEEGEEAPKPLWQRLASLIVPIGVVLYIIISALVNNDGG